MSDNVKVKEAVQELTKARAENVSLTGRLEGFEQEYARLGDLLNDAKLENAKLRRLLNGKIKELDAEKTDDKSPLLEARVSNSSDELSFVQLDRELWPDLESAKTTPEDLGPEIDSIPLDATPGPVCDQAQVQTRTDNDLGSWEPLILDVGTPEITEDSLKGTPPQLSPHPSTEMHLLLSNLTTSLAEQGSLPSDEKEKMETSLAKLDSDLLAFEDEHCRDKKILDELRTVCGERKSRIQRLELEMMQLKMAKADLERPFLREELERSVTEETQTDPETPETPPRSREKILDLQKRLEAMDRERRDINARLSSIMADDRQEVSTYQARLDHMQQEMALQMSTNRTLQTKIMDLESQNWNQHQQIAELRTENERIRTERRTDLRSMVSAKPSATVEQELEVARYQADTYREDFNNEHEEKEKLTREKDDLLEKLKKVTDQYDKLKFSSEKKERMLKRRVENMDKEIRDLSRVVSEYERQGSVLVHEEITPASGQNDPAPRRPPATQQTNVETWAAGNFPVDIRARGGPAPQEPVLNIRPVRGPAAAPTGPLARGPQVMPPHAPAATTARPARTEEAYNENLTINIHPVTNTEGHDWNQLYDPAVPSAPLAVQLPPKSDAGMTSILEPNWPCRTCTFSNYPRLTECEMCGTKRMPNFRLSTP